MQPYDGSLARVGSHRHALPGVYALRRSPPSPQRMIQRHVPILRSSPMILYSHQSPAITDYARDAEREPLAIARIQLRNQRHLSRLSRRISRRQTRKHDVRRCPHSDRDRGCDRRVGRFRSHHHAECACSLGVLGCDPELAALSVERVVRLDIAPSSSSQNAGNASSFAAFHRIVAVSGVRRKIEMLRAARADGQIRRRTERQNRSRPHCHSHHPVYIGAPSRSKPHRESSRALGAARSHSEAAASVRDAGQRRTDAASRPARNRIAAVGSSRAQIESLRGARRDFQTGRSRVRHAGTRADIHRDHAVSSRAAAGSIRHSEASRSIRRSARSDRVDAASVRNAGNAGIHARGGPASNSETPVASVIRRVNLNRSAGRHSRSRARSSISDTRSNNLHRHLPSD